MEQVGKYKYLGSNKKVLNQAGAKMKVIRVIRQRQLRLLGYVMRGQQMQSYCVTGMLDGRRE